VSHPGKPKGTAERLTESEAHVGAGPSPEAVWPRVLEIAGPRLKAMLDTMRVQSATPKLLSLGVPSSRAAMARDHLPEIVRLVQQTGARSMSIQFVDLKEAAPEQPSPSAGTDTGSVASPTESLSKADAEDHPLVREAIRVFRATVAHVHQKRRE